MKLSTGIRAALSVAALLGATECVGPAAAQVVAAGAKKPCLEAGGVAINLNGNFGFCYLKGRRMHRGSVFAQCQDGVISCFADEGIPDKPREKVKCIAPEPGFCGSDKNATPAPTTAKPTVNTTTGSDVDDTEVGDEDVSGENPITDGPDRDADEEEEEEEETRAAKKPHTVNPSALVAGNLPNGEIYEDDEADDEDSGNAAGEDEDDDGVYR